MQSHVEYLVLVGTLLEYLYALTVYDHNLLVVGSSSYPIVSATKPSKTQFSKLETKSTIKNKTKR